MRPLGRGLADLLIRKLLLRRLATEAWRCPVICRQGLAILRVVGLPTLKFGGLHVCQLSACRPADLQVCESLHLQVCRLNSTV